VIRLTRSRSNSTTSSDPGRARDSAQPPPSAKETREEKTLRDLVCWAFPVSALGVPCSRSLPFRSKQRDHLKRSLIDAHTHKRVMSSRLDHHETTKSRYHHTTNFDPSTADGDTCSCSSSSPSSSESSTDGDLAPSAMIPVPNRTSGTYGLPLSPSSTAFNPNLVTRTGSPLGRRRSNGGPPTGGSSSPLKPVFEETIGLSSSSGLGSASSALGDQPIKSHSGSISYSNVKAFLSNPLAIPTNRPYLRLLITLLIWGLSITVITNLIGASTPEPATLLARLKGTHYSGLADWEILDRAENLRSHSPFPHPPNRPLDRLASPNEAYRAMHPLKQPPKPFPELRATKFLPDRCLEGWFVHGEMLCARAEVGEEDQL